MPGLTSARTCSALLAVICVAGFDLGVSWSDWECQREKNCDDGQQAGDKASARFFHILKYHFNSTASLQLDSDLAIALCSDVDDSAIRTLRKP